MRMYQVEYQVKPDKLTELMPVIGDFVAAAQEDMVHVAQYNGYQYSDQPTQFVHIMRFETEADEKAHQNADYTKKFVAALYPNCVREPVFTAIHEV